MGWMVSAPPEELFLAHVRLARSRPGWSWPSPWSPRSRLSSVVVPCATLECFRWHVPLPRSTPTFSAFPDGNKRLVANSGRFIWAADPDIMETIKRSVQPYFVMDGNVCASLATKDHINPFLYDPTVPDPRASSIKVMETRRRELSRSMRVTASTAQL